MTTWPHGRPREPFFEQAVGPCMPATPCLPPPQLPAHAPTHGSGMMYKPAIKLTHDHLWQCACTVVHHQARQFAAQNPMSGRDAAALARAASSCLLAVEQPLRKRSWKRSTLSASRVERHSSPLSASEELAGSCSSSS
mmetsp:Transcript_33336/g.73709  ORF Transcript_33336/g.73709 Transcript_33336/m.73709 type:complete len:138 (+) Transcript_33336:162-575(+)